MPRTQKAEILNLENKINDVMASRGHDCRVMVQSANCHPMCHLIRSGKHLVMNLSPRLPKKEMVIWLQAFYDGLTFQPPYVNRGGKFRGEE